MPSHLLNTIFLIAFGSMSTGTLAQNIHKCGATYSQTPCSDGVVLNATDPRTHAQKAQSELNTIRDTRTADAMEKARLKQEKTDLAASAPPAASTATAGGTGTPSKAKQKKKKPPYFTARTANKEKKKPHKQSAENEPARRP